MGTRNIRPHRQASMEEQWALGLVVAMIVLLFVSSTRTDLANIGHHRSQAAQELASSKTD